MHDLDTRLERLAAEATRETVPPRRWRRSPGAAGGHRFGKTDASVFLDQGVTPAQRDTIRRRIQSLKVVDRVYYYESQADAWARARDLYRTKPAVTPKALEGLAFPESFRVRLHDPEQFPALQRALCPGMPVKATGSSGCMDGVEAVMAEKRASPPSCCPRHGRPAPTSACSCPSAPPQPNGRRSGPGWRGSTGWPR